MSPAPFELDALEALCDVIDANASTLRVIMPRDREGVAECCARADDAELARHANMLLAVAVKDERVDDALAELLQTIAHFGLPCSILGDLADATDAQLLLRVDAAA